VRVIALRLANGRTLADLAATADALLARGVPILFLALPMWDPQDREDPLRNECSEACWKIAETMPDSLIPVSRQPR